MSKMSNVKNVKFRFVWGITNRGWNRFIYKYIYLILLYIYIYYAHVYERRFDKIDI